MNFVRKVIKLLCILGVVVTGINGYRILGIFPVNAEGHDTVFQALMKGLARLGHQVDVISHFDARNPPSNYKTIIKLRGKPTFDTKIDFENTTSMGKDPLHYIITPTYGNELCEIMSVKLMRKFIKKLPYTYDVVIIETFGANCFIGFGYVLRVPVITLSSMLEFPWAIEAVGNPHSSGFATNLFMKTTSISTFGERFRSTVAFHVAKFIFNWYTETPQTEAMRKYLSPNIPDIRRVEKSVALMLTNYDHTLFGIRPVVPAVVDISGIQADDNDETMLDYLQQWLDESVHGVVYFTFGARVLIETLPEEILRAFYASFEKLAPVRVLMKLVDLDKIPADLPLNMMTSQWIPQVPVLMHKNTKAFITHGGLMGTQEALYSGVPMIIIPIFTDQFSNVDIYVKKNMAIKLDLEKINEEILDEALNKILNDTKYRFSAIYESELFRDRPLSTIDTADFWIQYIIRNGADALRSPAVDMHWWQVELLDVYALILLLFIIFVCFVILLIIFGVHRILKIAKDRAEHIKEKERMKRIKKIKKKLN